MKDYADYLLTCKCSKRMKRGVHVKIYETPTTKTCPNCKQVFDVMEIVIGTYERKAGNKNEI